MDAHVNRLRAAFAAQLLAQQPESVLDLGCGAGFLLAACAAAEVPAVGADLAAARVAGARAAGHLAVAGSLYAPPFAAGSFDWVAIRHVLHHLDDPAAALAAAARIARSGVVVAEPWNDSLLPEQRVAMAVDAWSRRQDRRQGRVHHANHAAAAIVAMAAVTGLQAIALETVLPIAREDAAALQARLEPLLEGLPAADPDRQAHRALLARAAREGCGRPGPVVVVLRFAAGSV
ncbi:MAG TPA: methyltransferase domain-containing protein [Planctomycetota bacterium]